MDSEEYEYYEEWLDRAPEYDSMSLEEFNDMRCIQDYGLSDEEIDSVFKE